MGPLKSLVWLSHRWDRSFSTLFHAVFSLWLPGQDCRSFSFVMRCLLAFGRRLRPTKLVSDWKSGCAFLVGHRVLGSNICIGPDGLNPGIFCMYIWIEDGISWSCVYDSFKDELSRFCAWIASDVQFCCWCASSPSLTKQHHRTLFTHKSCSTSVGESASCAGSFTHSLFNSMVIIPLWSCQKVPDTFWCGTARVAEILCIICRAGQALKRERERLF